MAKNPSKTSASSGKWVTRDPRTGQFMEIKPSERPAKTGAATPKSRRVIEENSSKHRDALKRLADK